MSVTTLERTDSPYRLPRSVVPRRYDLVLEPDLGAQTFTGAEDVTVRIEEPVDRIVLNAAGLALSSGRLEADGRRIEITEIELDEATERAVLRLAGTAEAGEAVLHLEFAGVLDPQLRGFYPSTYDDEHGVSRLVATTQFESTDARRAFPCWDEPDLKAVFAVTLVVPDGSLAISNGPEVGRESLPDGRVRVRFADTMTMSTYLVAFIVGPLSVTEPVDVDGVPLRLVQIPGKERLSSYALEIGAFSLRFFSEYYAIPYPDRKLDMVALPDFAQGAMENLGCITYRESLLLADPEHATQSELMGIADTVAHEIAHMWFGDLVTMRWWNGIWLNEAFATFMELLTVDAFRPDWDRWALFLRQRSTAFEVDALDSTRPIEYPVESPDDASGMFDVLTYIKGASVLRMLEQYLGAERFRDGIRAYLKRHEYGNTETHDLWDAIEETTGEPVRRIMDGWILQGGHPLISVEPTNHGVRLSQQRLRLGGPDDGLRWDVPLLVRHAGETAPVLIDAESKDVPLADPSGPVVVNAGAHGFVRVRYAPELLRRLTDDLTRLSGVERYGLVDDAWTAVLAGEMSAVEFCTLAEAFGTETELPVWQAVLGGLAWLERFVEGSARESFARFVRELTEPALERLGWEPVAGESDLDRMLRGSLLGAIGTIGKDPRAVTFAQELEAAAETGEPVDPALASAAVAIVAATGGVEDFDRFVDRWHSSPTPQEQLRYLYSLGEFRDPALVDRAMRLVLDGDVRSQNAPGVLVRSVANREHGDRAWRTLREHWAEIDAKVAPTTLVYCADGVRYLTTRAQADDAAAFFAAHPIPQSARQLAQLLERQRVTAALRERAAPELERRFS
jgi:puromycin-sensitive aminopeptidase